MPAGFWKIFVGLIGAVVAVIAFAGGMNWAARAIADATGIPSGHVMLGLMSAYTLICCAAGAYSVAKIRGRQ